MQEIWKDVSGYENLYQVSNLGKVKSIRANKFLKQVITDKGYLKVCLQSKGSKKWFRIHRLVALNFIPNPKNLPEINHIDCNKQNNCVSNLEWSDRKHNMQEASKFGLIKSIKVKINQYDLSGNFIRQWDSIHEASENVSNSQNANTNISGVLRGKRKTAYGYIWKYAD